MRNQREDKSLLVVEPQPVMAGLGPLLHAGGWRVHVAPSLLDALVRLAREGFAAMLVHEDVLPQAASALEEARRLCPHMAIVVTVESFREVTGADDWVVLPCRLNGLVRVLERACESQMARRRLAEIEKEIEQLNSRCTVQTRQLEALEKVSRQLGRAVSDLQPLLRTALDLFREVAGAERLSLMLLEENGAETLRILEARGLSDSVVAQTRLKLGEGVAGWVAKYGRPVLATRGKAPPWHRWEERAYRSDSFVSVPLKVGDEVLGVVNLTERLGGPAFSEGELKALELLAGQTAAWIRHCQKLQKMQRLSLIDEVTSLYNRRYLMNCLEREVKRADRAGQQLTLAMLDMDYFKVYNDTYGHQAGDRLLREFAGVLQNSIRASDIVCRYGGDEFALILPETAKEDDYGADRGPHFLERLRSVISEHPFGGREVQPGGRVTVSIGVAAFPRDGRRPDELIAAADEMLYAAKRGGRDRVCLRERSGSPTGQEQT